MIEIFAGRYELLRPLGKGGMGEVFLARDLTTRSECALKRLTAGASSRIAEARREFEVLTRLRHPTVVSVLELGVAPDGTPYYTMEYVPGVPADRAVRVGDWPALFFFAAEVANGLEALHSLGVVHGDIKPSNLLVMPGTAPDALPASVRLLDFGLAAMLGRDAQGRCGTPGYAAPEVVRGESPGPPADLYGLGSTLYTLGAGRRAFEVESGGSALRKQQSGPPSAVPLEEAGVPPALIQIVLRLMAPEAGERPRDAREVRRELESLHPAARRPLAHRLQTAVVTGRERELAMLEQRLARTGKRSRVIVIAGETGIGKSALMRELAARLTLGGRPVFHIACGSMRQPGAAGMALLRRFAAHAEDQELQRDDASSPSWPEFAEAGVDSDFAPWVEAAVEWQRRIEKLSGTPVVLLDDSDHLDPASRALIRRLVLHPLGPPTLWVWTRRGGLHDPPDDERVLLDAEVAEAVELGALKRANAARMIAARLNQPAPESLESFLWERASGHPGLTVELLLLAAARGALRDGDAGLLADPEAMAAVDVPPTFEALLAARFAGLPEAARKAAAALAVQRAPVPLERVQSIEPESQLDTMDLLIVSGLAWRDSAGRIALASPAFAERLLEGLGTEARRGLHRRALQGSRLSNAERFHHLHGAGDVDGALEAAEAAHAERADAGLAAVAATLAESRSPELAASWHERAGRELSSVGRYQNAVSHLERALELGGAVDDLHRRRFLLSTALLRAGRHAEVARIDAQALAKHPPDAIRSRLLTNEAARLQAVGEWNESMAAAEQALALGESASDAEASGLAAHALAYTLLALGRPDEAEPIASRAALSFERAGKVMGQIRARAASAEIARAQQRLGDAERLYREALASARGQGIRLAMEELLNGLARVLAETGRWAETREMYSEAARLALEDHRPRGAAVAITNLSQVDGLAGRPPVARRQARAAIRLTRAHAPWLETVAWRSLAQAKRIGGRWSRAERAARRALQLAERSGFREEVDWSRIEYGRLLMARGRWNQAAELWEPALQGSRSHGSVGYAILNTLSGRAALRRGDAALAASRLEAVESWLAGRCAPYAAALTHQLRAEMAISQNHLSEAIMEVDRWDPLESTCRHASLSIL